MDDSKREEAREVDPFDFDELPDGTRVAVTFEGKPITVLTVDAEWANPPCFREAGGAWFRMENVTGYYGNGARYHVVTESALTPPADPTDDEREALVAILVNNRQVIAGSMHQYVDSETTADLVLASGFRRPTRATREMVAEFIEDNTGVDWLHGSPDGLTDALMSRFTITPKVDPDAENY